MRSRCVGSNDLRSESDDVEENNDEAEVVKTGVEKENRMSNWNRTRNRSRKKK